jgi:putative flippase GtrA
MRYLNDGDFYDTQVTGEKRSLFDGTFLKFIMVGIINTIVGSAIMFGLYNLLGFNYWFSSAVNYVIGSIMSFFLNKYFTFAIKEWTPFMVATFALNIAFCYFFAYGIAKPVMNYLLQNRTQKIRENAALLTGMCIFTGLNYIGQRFFVFKRKTHENI